MGIMSCVQICEVIKTRWWLEIDAMTTTQHNIATAHAAAAASSPNAATFAKFTLKLHTRLRTDRRIKRQIKTVSIVIRLIFKRVLGSQY